MDHSAVSWDSFFTGLDDMYKDRVKKVNHKASGTANLQSTKPKQRPSEKCTKATAKIAASKEISIVAKSTKSSTRRSTKSPQRSGTDKIVTTANTTHLPRNKVTKSSTKNGVATNNSISTDITRRYWDDEITITKDGYIFMSSPKDNSFSKTRGTLQSCTDRITPTEDGYLIDCTPGAQSDKDTTTAEDSSMSLTEDTTLSADNTPKSDMEAKTTTEGHHRTNSSSIDDTSRSQTDRNASTYLHGSPTTEHSLSTDSTVRTSMNDKTTEADRPPSSSDHVKQQPIRMTLVFSNNQWSQKMKSLEHHRGSESSNVHESDVSPDFATLSTGVLRDVTNQQPNRKATASKRPYDGQDDYVGAPQKRQRVG